MTSPRPAGANATTARRLFELVEPIGAVDSSLQEGGAYPEVVLGHVRQALDRAGFDWVSSHVFRKTVATRLDEAGLSARQIADHLGHNRPSLTQDVYMGRGLASPEAATALQRSR